jgi:aminoglycoside 3-N-acetyltransferase I
VDNKKIQIKKLTGQDTLLFQKLILLFQDVFEMENPVTVKVSYLKHLLNKSGFIVLIITCENKIVGGLTAYELPMYYAECAEVYMYDIAIQPEFQRKGFGSKLLAALKEYCGENKITGFFVEAHEADKHAVAFYSRAGGKAEKVVHFNFEA